MDGLVLEASLTTLFMGHLQSWLLPRSLAGLLLSPLLLLSVGCTDDGLVICSLLPHSYVPQLPGETPKRSV